MPYEQKTLLEVVDRYTRKTARKTLISWNEVTEAMNALSGESLTRETYRHAWRILKDEKYRKRYREKVKTVDSHLQRSFERGHNVEEAHDILKIELKSLRSMTQLCYATKLDEISVLGHIELLRREGYEISASRVDGEMAYIFNRQVETTYHEYKRYYEINRKFRIGLISDTHIGSRFWQKSHLDAAYDMFAQLGITDVFHVGDVTDGFYKDRMSEIYLYGADEQADEVVEKYPKRPGIITRFITGNHDETHLRNGGTNIGRAIANRRDDMIYLGHNYAKVWLSEGTDEKKGVDIDLIHPGDGTSYALSYQLQKRINNMSGGDKPKILVTGHYHKYFVMFYRNVIAISLPSFQAQSGWMRGKGLQSDMGYVVLELEVNADNDIVHCSHNFYPFFTEKRNNY
jgi:predicted phosphodiesterase